MKKIVPFLLLVLLFSARLSAQTCTVLDSFNLNAPSVDTTHMMQAEAITFSGGYLWIAASNNYQRTFFLDTVHIYKYTTAGVRVDSIWYIMGSVNQLIDNLAGDGTYLWAMRLTTDSLYKFNIATKSLVATYGMAGRGTYDLGYTMASVGDTLYFIGKNTGKCFKFKKSTGVFIDRANYTGHLGTYPSGAVGVGNNLVTTTYLNLVPVSFDNVSVVAPGTMTENISSRANWCIDIPDGLAFGGGYFWQIKSTFLFFDIRTCYVYRVQSSLSSLATGVDEVTSEADFAINPNPASETINISYPSTNEWSSFSVSLYDITGVKKLSQPISGNNGKASIDISRLHLSTGMYFLQLSNGTQQVMKKVCVY